MDDQQKVTLKISGSSMDKAEGYDLKSLLYVLQSFETITEKTYLFAGSRSRMHEKDMDTFQVVMTEIREGSFVADLVIKSGNNTIQICTGNNSPVLVFPSYIPDFAEKIAPDMVKMVKPIGENNVESISIDGMGDETMLLNAEDKARFGSREYWRDEPVVIRGKIVAMNATRGSGKIECINQDGLVQQYSCDLIRELQTEEFLRLVFLVDHDYKCFQKVKFDLSKGLQEQVTAVRIVELL